MRLTTQGIVLRETNYKEADKILTVLTRDWGKRTVKARGCRRKNSKLTAASQLLVYSELTLFERGEFTTLTEADPLEQFWSVRQDLETLALASYFAEVAEASAQEGETCPELLSLLLNCLYALDTLKKPRLHLSQGVLCCAACRGQLGGGVSMPLSPGALAAARYIVSGPPKKLFSFALAEESLRQLGQATEAFLMTQQERGFRTLDYYKQLERSLPEAGRG
mgnify:CR=1 FL=1